MAKYGCDIGLGARIGKGFVLPHHSGVVIHGNVKIGENVIIRQNTTIGEKESDSRENYIVIGDNVDVGAHTCIIGLNVKIGSNVKLEQCLLLWKMFRITVLMLPGKNLG